MSNFINGVGKPRFEIRNVGTTNAIDLIDLPETLQPNGLTEIWQKQDIRATVISPSLTNYSQRTLVKTLGWNVQFNFDYESWMIKDEILNVKKLCDYFAFGYEIWLIPRVDYLSRKFKVQMTEDTNLVIQAMKGSENSIGNRGITFSFLNVDLLPRFDIRDPDQAEWFTYSQFPKFVCIS